MRPAAGGPEWACSRYRPGFCSPRCSPPPRQPPSAGRAPSAAPPRDVWSAASCAANNDLWATFNPVTGAYPNAAARRWGTDRTLATIERVTLAYSRKFPTAPRVIIGDISLKHGGRFGAHASHQQGLDVDVYYPRRGGGRAMAPRGPGDTDRRRSQWLIERFAAERAKVVYVGVRVGIRRSRSNIRYLGVNHETHFHVRLGR